MSRIGKQPVIVPEKVQVNITDEKVVVKGPKGELNCDVLPAVAVVQNENTIVVSPNEKSDEKNKKAYWGLTRTLINNMVLGVTQGFKKELEFTGVGYKATVKGDSLLLNLGYSHPIDYKIPAGVSAKVTKNVITLEGIDKSLVGFVAAKVRSFRPPEPYKGKGIKYIDEVILRKAGKTGAKK